ncbi:hypothetical protein DBV05_g10899 [Lasiodiplodia theobromae]|uniref:ZZ-type domain-containing protein n=1 Tax=Lasiodiplodia theobromae TaxID=45133 RepID=A0A5N5CYS6_9PEZI|nr:hypothetical protein DBV05_g10899 [Lasiodiplodia theobromae]
MGLHDTFDFDEPAYIAKTAARTTPQLQEEEIKKLRQHFAASCSIGAGVGHSIHSAGISLGVSAFGLRRLVVARRKLAIIRAELTARGVKLHDPTKRDVAIPVGAALAGMGLGAEIGHLVGGLMPTPGLPPGTHLDQAGNVVGDLAGASEGFVHGLADQSHAVGHAVHEQVAGALAGHVGAEAAAGAAGAAGDGHAVGYVAGILAAKKTEEFIAEVVGEAVFAYAMEKLLDPEIKVELALKGKCSRLLGPLGQYCRGCGQSIREGRFAHCCQGGDDYDLCMPCFGNGVSCQCTDREMVIMQKSVAGDVVISEKGETNRRLAAAPKVNCVGCQKEVTQGRYYYCDSCNESKDGYDLCESCYESGHTCETPDEHRLYVYLRANVPENVGPYTYISVDAVPCNTCEKRVEQGPYYYCPNCGDFAMCERCYEMGRSCKNREAGHILIRYCAYSAMYSVSGDFHDKKCRFCKGSLGKSRDSFYRCTKCDDGHYDLCGSCYTKGAGCEDRTHSLAKYIIQ